jgi:hypothetical protein
MNDIKKSFDIVRSSDFIISITRTEPNASMGDGSIQIRRASKEVEIQTEDIETLDENT